LPRAHKENDRDKTPKPATFIELEGLNDLARLTCALERAPLPTFASKFESCYRMSTQLDFFHGSPVFYYSLSKETKQYLGYKATSSGEEISMVDIPSNPALVYSPIIEIVKLPKLFETATERQESSDPKFQSIQVKDLMSLVKIATYKLVFEEPPLPIFAFPTHSRKWKIGTFARIEDFEEASLFFFFEQDSKPIENFVGYSTSKAQAYLTNRIEEHGSLFVKIIRLKASHPLVDTN
jgi:hypothetical protein